MRARIVAVYIVLVYDEPRAPIGGVDAASLSDSWRNGGGDEERDKGEQRRAAQDASVPVVLEGWLGAARLRCAGAIASRLCSAPLLSHHSSSSSWAVWPSLWGVGPPGKYRKHARVSRGA